MIQGDICGDNRFEIIAKFKKALIDGTNIESRPEEMAVIDSILFRFWQMGWLEFIDNGLNNRIVLNVPTKDTHLEQKYKDALERAKDMLTYKEVRQEDMEYLFPELKESEDERIRKAILQFFELQDDNTTYFLVPKKDILAWLEKQGEQNFDYEHADIPKKDFAPIETKFKVGDWITNGGANPCYVKSIFGDYYELCSCEEFEYTKHIKDVDYTYHLWTIQDAKDGDVLYSIDSKQPFIYKERPQFSQARGYCCINKFGEFAIWNTSKCVICTDKYIPATKEQRDLLFRKMKEAGYVWDSEKKELKKIEVPSNESEDERVKKGLIKAVSRIFEGHKLFDTDVTREEALAWLKKQSKKLDADKVIEWLWTNDTDSAIKQKMVEQFKKDFDL